MILTSLFFIFNIFIFCLLSHNIIDLLLSPFQKKLIILIIYSINIVLFLFYTDQKKKYTNLIFLFSAIGLIALILSGSGIIYDYLSVIYYSIVIVILLGLKIPFDYRFCYILSFFCGSLTLIFLYSYFNFIIFIDSLSIVPTFENKFEKQFLAFVILTCLIINFMKISKINFYTGLLPILLSIGLLGNRSAILSSIIYIGFSAHINNLKFKYTLLSLFFILFGYFINTDTFIKYVSNRYNCESLIINNSSLLCGLSSVKAINMTSTNVEAQKILREEINRIRYSTDAKPNFKENVDELSYYYLRSGKNLDIENTLKPDVPRILLWKSFFYDLKELPFLGYSAVGSPARTIPTGFAENPELYKMTLLHNFIFQSFNDFGIFLSLLFFLIYAINVKLNLNLNKFMVIFIPFACFFSFQNGFSLYMLSLQTLLFCWLVSIDNN